jgi:glutamine synthetase adenylyltransferase
VFKELFIAQYLVIAQANKCLQLESKRKAPLAVKLLAAYELLAKEYLGTVEGKS